MNNVVIHTVCQNCIFAQFTEGRQTGCECGAIDKFIEHDVDIDDSEGYYTILGRVCPFQRYKEWGDDKQGEDLVAQIREEVFLHADLVLYIPPTASEEDIRTTLQSIKDIQADQGLVPAFICVVNNNKSIRPNKFIKIWNEYRLCIPWRLECVVDDDMTTADCIDLGVEKCVNIYYSVFLAGYRIPKLYYTKIDNRIFGDLDVVIAIKPFDEWNGLFASIMLHQQAGGNREDLFINKIIRISESQECPNVVLEALK